MTDTTLAIARNLSATGIAQPQAEAIANAIGKHNEEIATKDFVRSEISVLRAEMKAEMSALETRLVRWIVGTGIALAGIMSGVLFALFQFMP